MSADFSGCLFAVWGEEGTRDTGYVDTAPEHAGNRCKDKILTKTGTFFISLNVDDTSKIMTMN